MQPPLPYVSGCLGPPSQPHPWGEKRSRLPRSVPPPCPSVPQQTVNISHNDGHTRDGSTVSEGRGTMTGQGGKTGNLYTEVPGFSGPVHAVVEFGRTRRTTTRTEGPRTNLASVPRTHGTPEDGTVRRSLPVPQRSRKTPLHSTTLGTPRVPPFKRFHIPLTQASPVRIRTHSEPVPRTE